MEQASSCVDVYVLFIRAYSVYCVSRLLGILHTLHTASSPFHGSVRTGVPSNMKYDRTVPYWFLASTVKLMRLILLVGAYELRVGLVVCVEGRR